MLVKSFKFTQPKKDFGIAPHGNHPFIFEAACDSHQATFQKFETQQDLTNSDQRWKDRVRGALGYWYSSRYKRIVRKYRKIARIGYFAWA